MMNFNTNVSYFTTDDPVTLGAYQIILDPEPRPSLIIRMANKLAVLLSNVSIYLQRHFDGHATASIASISVLTIFLSIICCFIISLVREEGRNITQYKKLVNGSTLPKIHSIELRRETYFGLVRLRKPGCRTIVLLCDVQSRMKLLAKFHQCLYPYRKNKTLQFAFLHIEKNIGWYRELLKLALNERRNLHINPINCIGTVLVLNGFKKYFSVYHASGSSDSSILLEESLLDNLPEWLERLFAGKTNRYYVKYWPDQMR